MYNYLCNYKKTTYNNKKIMCTQYTQEYICKDFNFFFTETLDVNR